MKTNEQLAQALRELANKFSESWHYGLRIDDSDIVLLTGAADALAAHEPEKAAPVAVPTGWKLVPTEPTPDMMKACEAEWFGSQVDMAKREWAAMLSAAPAAPMAVRLTDEESESLQVWRWYGGLVPPFAQREIACHLESMFAARWGVKLEGVE